MAKGILKYTAAEGSNIKLGQNGFKELDSAGSTGDGDFVAFLITGAAVTDKATIAATTHMGDDLTATPFLSKSLVYGPFKNITMSSPTDGDVHVLCYYG